jgi:hypothetical protein
MCAVIGEGAALPLQLGDRAHAPLHHPRGAARRLTAG